jgi:tetratricopeptide (TPR) repeat protein
VSPTDRRSFPGKEESKMALDRLRELFEQGRMALYRGGEPGELERAKGLLEEARKALVETKAEDPTAQLLLGEVEYELGNFYYGSGQRQEAEARFQAALEAAENALASRETADGHCLLGESLSRLIEFKGWTFAMSAGPKAKKEFERALALDPESPRAHIDLALSYFFTPKMFGGSLNKACELLQKALDLAHTPHTQFLAHVWLYQVLKKLGRDEEARAHAEAARGIYPQSRWVNALLTEGETG